MYEPLSKYFHKDKITYKKIADDRTNNELVKYLDFTIGSNKVFYLPVPELTKSIINIYRMDKKIRILEEKLPGKALEHFSDRCLIDEIVLTNKIEGVHSTRKEIGKILQEIDKKESSKHRFKGLVMKYNLLFKNSELSLLTCQDIRNIYDDLVLPEIINMSKSDMPDGDIFRKESVCVYSETQKIIHEGVYPEKIICEMMEKALNILNNDNVETLIKIAAFHYFCGYIHPFYDGNGRLCRFISSYLISKELEPILSFRISYTIHENIKEYYRAFDICNNTKNMGDITPFLIMFIGIIEKSIYQLEEALQKRLDRFCYYKETVNNLKNSNEDNCYRIYNILVQASLFAENGISNSELKSVLKMSSSTLTKYMKKVREGGLIIETKQGKEKLYSLDLEKLDIVLMEKDSISEDEKQGK